MISRYKVHTLLNRTSCFWSLSELVIQYQWKAHLFTAEVNFSRFDLCYSTCQEMGSDNESESLLAPRSQHVVLVICFTVILQPSE